MVTEMVTATVIGIAHSGDGQISHAGRVGRIVVGTKVIPTTAPPLMAMAMLTLLDGM